MISWFKTATNPRWEWLYFLAINQQLHGNYARARTEGGMDIEIILPSKLFSDVPSSFSALSS